MIKRIALLLTVAALAPSLSGCGAIMQTFNPGAKTYLARIDGEATLARAVAEKQVAVQASKAKFEAADYEANAEVRRAQGLAQAIHITGEALQKNPEYLRYLYVNNLAESHDQIIYVPTEAGLPILEAGKRPAREPKVEAIETK